MSKFAPSAKPSLAASYLREHLEANGYQDKPRTAARPRSTSIAPARLNEHALAINCPLPVNENFLIETTETKEAWKIRRRQGQDSGRSQHELGVVARF